MDNNSNPHAPSNATTDFTPAAASPESVIGTLGRFQLRQEIGQGSFGIVYRAYDPVLERQVALKVPKFAADRPDLRERFLREAKAAARLRHPNIVTVHDCGTDGDRLYIAFEFVEGKPLSEYLVSERPGYRQIAQWVRDLALALHHAHEQGVLHRDVKPANVLIDLHRRCRLTDFGLSKDVLGPVSAAGGAAPADAALTREGVAPGTPAYMAPEQARGDAAAVGPRTDQYGLAVVLYELLTGHRPYEGPADRVIALAADPLVEPKRPREHDADIPYGLEAIAWKALRKDPQERYADLSEMAVDLQHWLKGEPVSVPLRAEGDERRRCPACGRSTLGRLRCSCCDADLTGVEPDSGLPEPVPVRDGEDLADYPLDPPVGLARLLFPKRPFLLLGLTVLLPAVIVLSTAWCWIVDEYRYEREIREFASRTGNHTAGARADYRRQLDDERAKLGWRRYAAAGLAALPEAQSVLQGWLDLDKGPTFAPDQRGANERRLWWFVGLMAVYVVGLPGAWALMRQRVRAELLEHRLRARRVNEQVERRTRRCT